MSTAASILSNHSYFYSASRSDTQTESHSSEATMNHDKLRPSTAFTTNVCANTAVPTCGDIVARSSTISLLVLWYRALQPTWNLPTRRSQILRRHKLPSLRKSRQSGRSRFLTRLDKSSTASRANDSNQSTHSCQMHPHLLANRRLRQDHPVQEHPARAKAQVATKVALYCVSTVVSHR